MRPQKGRQKIYDAALMLFEKQGYFATTVEQITAQAGVSKGLVYNYFSSKEELLVGLIQDTTEKMEAVAGIWAPAETLEASLGAFIDSFFGYLESERSFLKLQLTLMLMPELRSHVQQPQQERAALILEIVTGWFLHWKEDDAENKARLLTAMLDGIALHYLMIYEDYPLHTMKPIIIEAANQLCKNTNQGVQ